MPRTQRRSQAGFTLVEIAIVLVIIGLILGGVLKGQELVTSARVRNIADQQNAIKAAFFAFQDRYKALPGDYAEASINIPNLKNAGKTTTIAAACPDGYADGDGDGFINYSSGAGACATEPQESVWAFLHLSAAGFIACSACVTNGDSTTALPTQNNSPTNAYGGPLQLAYDNCFGAGLTGCTSGTANLANNLKTGASIPSNILAEVDGKLDDGNPNTGSFQFSPWYANPGTAPDPAKCLMGTAPNVVWNRQSPSTNCGAAYTF